MNTRRMQKKHTTQVARPLPGKPKGVAELTDAELNYVTGGALQAYIKISGTKQGQAKGSG